MDISWISSEAKTLHALFVSIFYLAATVLLLIGVLIEYFKMPLGGMPAFTQLIGRALVAALLLVAYPEISNAVASVADAIADNIGSLSNFHNVLQAAGAALKAHSWSWTSIGDSLLSVVSFVAYLILYLSVFFFDAAIVYCLVLLYIFSPVMIVFYILPQTASMTGGLFRTLFEIATWKIVFAVLGTLLWSTALNNFKNSDQGNFITLLALILMLAFSILLTPLVVRNLISGALSNIATQTAGLAAIGLSAGALTPAAIAGATKLATTKSAKFVGRHSLRGVKAGYKGGSKLYNNTKNTFSRNIPADPK
jgi:hypothetical protein